MSQSESSATRARGSDVGGAHKGLDGGQSLRGPSLAGCQGWFEPWGSNEAVTTFERGSRGSELLAAVG